jgi:hypothetical protein
MMTIPSCTTQDTMPPPPAAGAPPITRAEFIELMQRVTAIERRSVRTETRVMRLMEHHGLDGHGQPLTTEA